MENNEICDFFINTYKTKQTLYRIKANPYLDLSNLLSVNKTKCYETSKFFY